MRPVRNRYGITRWIGERPVDEPLDRTPEPAKCGTPGGYRRHRRTHKEPACDACKRAEAEARQARRKRKAQAA